MPGKSNLVLLKERSLQRKTWGSVARQVKSQKLINPVLLTKIKDELNRLLDSISEKKVYFQTLEVQQKVISSYSSFMAGTLRYQDFLAGLQNYHAMLSSLKPGKGTFHKFPAKFHLSPVFRGHAGLYSHTFLRFAPINSFVTIPFLAPSSESLLAGLKKRKFGKKNLSLSIKDRLLSVLEMQMVPIIRLKFFQQDGSFMRKKFIKYFSGEMDNEILDFAFFLKEELVYPFFFEPFYLPGKKYLQGSDLHPSDIDAFCQRFQDIFDEAGCSQISWIVPAILASRPKSVKATLYFHPSNSSGWIQENYPVGFILPSNRSEAIFTSSFDLPEKKQVIFESELPGGIKPEKIKKICKEMWLYCLGEISTTGTHRVPEKIFDLQSYEKEGNKFLTFSLPAIEESNTNKIQEVNLTLKYRKNPWIIRSSSRRNFQDEPYRDWSCPDTKILCQRSWNRKKGTMVKIPLPYLSPGDYYFGIQISDVNGNSPVSNIVKLKYL
ncbi:hypothetical protein ACFL35_17180 [Candidatus Riflebacteria bacterium]